MLSAPSLSAKLEQPHSPIWELKEALQLLGKAIDLAGKRDIRLMASADRDLEPLWKDIAEI